MLNLISDLQKFAVHAGDYIDSILVSRNQVTILSSNILLTLLMDFCSSLPSALPSSKLIDLILPINLHLRRMTSQFQLWRTTSIAA